MFYVMIDDLRDIDDYVSGIDIADKKTIRTFHEGMKFVMNTNLSDVGLILDNDLGDMTPGNEGYDILSAIVDSNNMPREILLVTSNPAARSKMIRLIESLSIYTRVGNLFYR